MSKILPATCDAAGVVTCDGSIVPEALVLSLGAQASSGILLIDADKAWYFPSSATDIQSTLDKTAAAVDKIISILSSIGSNMTGPTTAPPPTLVTDLAALSTIKGELDLLKGALK